MFIDCGGAALSAPHGRILRRSTRLSDFKGAGRCIIRFIKTIDSYRNTIYIGLYLQILNIEHMRRGVACPCLISRYRIITPLPMHIIVHFSSAQAGLPPSLRLSSDQTRLLDALKNPCCLQTVYNCSSPDSSCSSWPSPFEVPSDSQDSQFSTLRLV